MNKENGLLRQETHASGRSKVDVYGWDIVDKRGEFKWIDKTILNVDHAYQRDNIKQSLITKMTNAWSWIGCGALTVGCREDKSLWVIDGQHRKIAADKRNDIKKLPCLVFHSCGQIDEAGGFLNGNGDRTSIKALEKFKAQIVAGHATAITVQNAVQAEGYEVTGSGDSNNSIKCISTMIRCCKKNETVFCQTISLLAQVYQGLPIPAAAFSGVFHAETYLQREYGQVSIMTEIRMQKLVQAGPERIADSGAKAKAYYEKGGPAVFGQGIVNVLNHRIKSCNKIPPVIKGE